MHRPWPGCAADSSRNGGLPLLAVVREPGGEGLTENAIIGALKETLANYKVPKRVLFLDELPRNAMGKVQKNALRERYGE